LDELWDTATVVAAPTLPRVALPSQPPAVYVYMVKALDSVGNYSIAPCATELIVRTDDDARFVDTWTMPIISTTNVAHWTLFANPIDYWTTYRGETISFGHADPNDATGTLGEFAALPFCVPTTDVESGVLTNVYDAALVVGGTWTVSANISFHTPPVAVKLILELSNNLSDWQQFIAVDETTVTASRAARYARAWLVSDGAFTLAGAPTMSLSAIPRVESGELMVGSAGTYTARTNGKFQGYVGETPVDLEYLGDENYTPERDGIVIAGDGTAHFDVYLRDLYGERVTGRVRWTFRGV
jgi:hypothetical protein